MSEKEGASRNWVGFVLAGLCSISSTATRSLPYLSVLFLVASLVLFSRALGRFIRSRSHAGSSGGESTSGSASGSTLPLAVCLGGGVAGLGSLGAGCVMAFAGVFSWHANRAKGIVFVVVGLLLVVQGVFFELGAFIGVMEGLGRGGPRVERARGLLRIILQAAVPWKKLDLD